MAKMKGCAPGVKGLGKKPSKTSNKTKKMFPFFINQPPSNTPGQPNTPGPGPAV